MTPPWGPEQRAYSEVEIDEFSRSPRALLAIRKQNESQMNSLFGVCIANSPAQNYSRDMMTMSMKGKLESKELESQLIPSYPVACRRVTPGLEYLSKVGSHNVDLVLGEIKEVLPTGCVGSDGTQYPLDILICATGFDTSYRPRFPIIGPGGRNLQDVWAKEPKGYMALAAPEFPNYFIFVGPNNSIASGPLLPVIGNGTVAWQFLSSANAQG